MDGYEVPIHRALTEIIMIAGVPRTVAMLNGTLAAALGLGMKSWCAVPLCLAIHIISVFVTKKDPQFFDCFRRHIRQKKYYAT